MNNIRRLREKTNLSVRELASKVDINYVSLSYLENGKQQIAEHYARKLADFFDVSIDELFARDFESNKNVVVKTVDFDYNDILHKIKNYSKSDLERLRGVIDFLLETRENGVHSKSLQDTLTK